MRKEGQDKDRNNLKTGWGKERRDGSLNATVRKTVRWCDCVTDIIVKQSFVHVPWHSAEGREGK